MSKRPATKHVCGGDLIRIWRERPADLDFEIRFYERLVQDHPDFVDALIPLGDAYTKRGHHDRGLAIDRRLTELRPEDPVVWYNFACSCSIVKRIPEALKALARAIALGYEEFDWILRDPDLAHLRKAPECQAFLAKVRPPKNARQSSRR